MPSPLLHTCTADYPLAAAGWKLATPNNPAPLGAPPVVLYPGQQAIATAVRHPSHPHGATSQPFRGEIAPLSANPASEFKHGEEYWLGLHPSNNVAKK